MFLLLTLVINLVGLLHLHIEDNDLDDPDLVLPCIVVLLEIHLLITMIRNDLLVIHRLFCITWHFLEHNGMMSLQMSYSSFNDVPTALLEPIVKNGAS